LNQLRELINRLSLRQKISIGVAITVALGGMFWFIQAQKEKDYKLLFKDMVAEDAGQLTARLREKNVDYKIGEDGASIMCVAPSCAS